MEDDKAFTIVEAKATRASKRELEQFTRQDVVNAFQRAFETIGGTTRLALWANANPDRFYPLYAKLLPSTAINFGSGGVQVLEHSIPPTPLDQHPGTEQATYIPREQAE
jgi:hypothetical protein